MLLTTEETMQLTKDEINVPIALSAFRDGDQGPSKVTKTEQTDNICDFILLWSEFVCLVLEKTTQTQLHQKAKMECITNTLRVDMLESKELTEQTEWRAKQPSQGWIRRSKVLRSLRRWPKAQKPRTPYHRSPGAKRQRSAIYLEGTKAGANVNRTNTGAAPKATPRGNFCVRLTEMEAERIWAFPGA